MNRFFYQIVSKRTPPRHLSLIWTAVLCISGLNTVRAAGATQTTEEDLFSSKEVIHVKVQIPEAGLKKLRESEGFRFGGGQTERPSVLCTVIEGGKEFKNVALHLKGSAGSFRQVDDNPALTLNFDKNSKGQTFHGLQKISLNNSVQDRSFLSEQLTREMFLKAGVPVPRATQVMMELNGRKLGMYVLTEGFNKQFLARHFKNTKGNLYDGGFIKDVTDDLVKSSGENPQDRSDLKKLAEVAQDNKTAGKFDRLSKLLDMDKFVSFLALDAMTCNWDGYGINRNNYRIYSDTAAGKIVFMPHGLDQMFGVMRAGTDMPLFPRMEGLVARAVMDTPEGMKLYREKVGQLITNVYQVEALTNRVRQLAARIAPALEKAGGDALRNQKRETDYLCERIVDRYASIIEQYKRPSTTLKFDDSGTAVLTGWKSRIDYGKPVIEEISDASGKKLFKISAANGSAVGSWFARVKLDPGHYRFEGRMKSVGIVPEPGDRKAGAGLRVTGKSFESKTPGDHDWTNVAYEFDVRSGGQGGFMGPISDAIPEVELSCHLRAAKGEALFDQGSLRLIRK